MKKWKILVTPKEAGEILEKKPDYLLEDIEFIFSNGRILDQGILKQELKLVDGVILDTEIINQEVLKDNHRLKIISRFGVGFDSINLDSLKEKNISLAITHAVSATAVARHSLALILASFHHLIEHKLNALDNKWERFSNNSYLDSPIGIIGYGNIGKALDNFLINLGFKTLVFKKNGNDLISLDEVLKKCKTISIHLPLTLETKNFFNHDLFNKMNGHTIINTSRGGVVNEEDLLIALENGKVKTYATDVFFNEPFQGTSLKLAKHKKVICTPHLAGLDQFTAEAMAKRSYLNALNYLEKNYSAINKLIVSNVDIL